MGFFGGNYPNHELADPNQVKKILAQTHHLIEATKSSTVKKHVSYSPFIEKNPENMSCTSKWNPDIRVEMVKKISVDGKSALNFQIKEHY